MEPLYRRTYLAAELMRGFPPELGHPNKQLVFELAMQGAAPSGMLEVTRWAAIALPPATPGACTDAAAVAGYYDYASDSAGVWHVNFADPNLFVAYGSGLLAQDELQCAEHPALGSVREALTAEGFETLTEAGGAPTPVLVANVERRCTLETAPDLAASRPYGLYGNQFARADASTIRRAVKLHRPAPMSNLIAIAAPVGSGRYTREQIEQVLVTASTGFAAAVAESARRWPGAAVEIRTGFWGCGAFGGNRELMTLLQLLAARLAGVDRLRFYAFDDAGRADFAAGAAALDHALAGAPTLPEVIARIAAAGYVWGTSNGT